MKDQGLQCPSLFFLPWAPRCYTAYVPARRSDQVRLSVPKIARYSFYRPRSDEKLSSLSITMQYSCIFRAVHDQRQGNRGTKNRGAKNVFTLWIEITYLKNRYSSNFPHKFIVDNSVDSCCSRAVSHQGQDPSMQTLFYAFD